MTTAQETSIEIQFEQGPKDIRCLAFNGVEAVGECSRFEMDVTTSEPLDTLDVLKRWVFVRLANRVSSRALTGIVTRLSRRAGGSYSGRRYAYRLEVRSSLALLGLTRRSRIFQNQSLPEIEKQVLLDGGFDAERVIFRLTAAHLPLRYVVQYDEDDASFLRRICERGGLHFFFTTGDDPEVIQEHLVVSDDSLRVVPELPPLACVDVGELSADSIYACRMRISGHLRAGRSCLRDYSPDHPQLDLKAEASAGGTVEQSIERSRAPAGFTDIDTGRVQARQLLDAHRVDSRQVHFETNALALHPGHTVDLEPLGSEDIVVAQGCHSIVSVNHSFSLAQGYRMTVSSILQRTAIRLPCVTHAPRISGVQSAWVTGPEGEEVFSDELGRVRIRFSWDRHGPTDEKSSLPVRVLQENTQGTMMLPRVGWEVWVGFEDGDPERPYVLGRSFNGLQPPPYALPVNKTVSTLRSLSSPGGQAMNSIEFNDAAGSQSLTFHAASGKTTTVGGDLNTQTDKSEVKSVGGAQIVSVSGSERIQVKQAHSVVVGSQVAVVGGAQEIGIKGAFSTQVGSETVVIAGSLLEQIGSPAAIAMSLASAAAIALATSELAKPWLKGKGHLMPLVIHAGKALYQGGLAGGLSMGLTTVVDQAAGKLPGGNALVLGTKMNLLGGRLPWEPNPVEDGPDGPHGANVAAQSAAGGASAGGAGNKDQMVKGTAIELVGGAQATVTPARVDWETSGGAANLAVGACHVTSCSSASQETLGPATETVGAHFVTVLGGAAIRAITSVATTQCGELTINSSGDLVAKAQTINLTFGELTLTGGSVTFKCGGSTVAFSAAGMMVESGTIRFTQTSAQSSDTKH